MIPEEIVFWTVERPLLNPSISSPVTHGLTHSLTLLCSVLTVLTSRVSKTKEMDCMNNMEGLLSRKDFPHTSLVILSLHPLHPLSL